ncbi:hypothetical protein [Sphingomonas endolithica]|uniref:hypothetical protein n=1 Tax=Sphingomonas endolithica TaxID=2972485 RepID=UPI0021AFCB3B|nr:hypothetical protein [Sphingomonas sp. ZFBP2030]
MADVKDVSRAVQAALEEIGVNGKLNVQMDGDEATASVGHPTGDDVDVSVTVSELDDDQPDSNSIAE